jgi:hypothetical protein
MKNILIGCEMSGIVRNAFAAKGHRVVSCDLKKSMSPGLHLQCDIFKAINIMHWDMLICFPPCRYLAKSQFHLLYASQARLEKAMEAIEFIDRIFSSNIDQIAIENPIGVIPKLWKNYDQLIYSKDFGDSINKDICLWLKNLPPLISTCLNPKNDKVSNHVNGRMSSAQKSEIKSIFHKGVAEAMANQWC